MATKRPGDDTNGHSGNGHAPDAKKTKDVSNITNIGVFPRKYLNNRKSVNFKWLPFYSPHRSALAGHCYSLEQLTGKK